MTIDMSVKASGDNSCAIVFALNDEVVVPNRLFPKHSQLGHGRVRRLSGRHPAVVTTRIEPSQKWNPFGAWNEVAMKGCSELSKSQVQLNWPAECP